MRGSIALIVICFFLVNSVFGQENSANEKSKNEEGNKGNHRITLGLGHTLMSKGVKNGEKVWIAEPSWSLNYDYWISNKWAVGLHTDLIVETFVIEDQDGNDLEREKPVALVPTAIFKPFRHFSFLAGGGMELEKEKNLGLIRLGVEAGWEIPGKWELGVELVWDEKLDYYNSWSIAFTISKLFGSKKRD